MKALTSVLAAILAVGAIPPAALAAPDPGEISRPTVAAQGHLLVAEKPKADPSAHLRMSKPDAVRWPAGSDRAISRRLGISGPVFRVTTSGPLSVNYSSFEHAFGGDWGPRLRFVQLPACALSTSERSECRVATPLTSRNDSEARTVSTSAAQPGMVVALEAADASAQGDYQATSLAASSTWNTVISSGAFSWSHPVRMPGVPGNLLPQVGLSYSSQAVDGRTGVTNNQGSWIGEGFSYEPGYIERRYKSCKDDGQANSAEQCWAFPNATIMMAGRGGALVKINDNTWALSNDDGSRIERLTGASNGDSDGEYWKVTTTNGTQYFFGLNQLPGYAAGNEETESAWTKPIYGDDAGEPCHQSSGFANSFCDQAWRWNLDYVIDTHGNAISYFYDREFNYYAQGGKTDVNGSRYVRSGHLARIDYGQRAGQVYTTNAPARVVFTTAERCLLDGSGNCTSYPDVPEDLVCAPSTKCKSTQSATTHFTRKRLARIETQLRQATTWSPVESWNLEHSFYINDDGSRSLWLKKVVHSGHWGGTTVTLPAVELDGIQLANRLDTPGDNVAPLYRPRLATIKTDSGLQVSVNYKPTDCVPGAPPAPEANTKRCFPVRWNPFGGAETNEIVDWFHKYVVDSVVEDDLVGGNPDMVTSYEYLGGAGWAKAKPDGITKDKYLMFSEWRGYHQVVARTGDGQLMPGKVTHDFLRGLGGTVADSTGKSYQDHEVWSGHELETTVYNGPEVVSKTINEPWKAVSHTQTEIWGVFESSFTDTETVRTLTALPGNAWRETKATTGFDPVWGRATMVDDLGDLEKAADDRCTRTWYADNPGKYLYSLTGRLQAVAVRCDLTANLATQLLSDDRNTYDAQGTATKVEVLDRFDGMNILYLTKSETTSVDGFGRPLVVKDPVGKVTTTAYTETNGLTTEVKETNPLSHVTTTTMDPGFGVPTLIKDPNDLLPTSRRRTELAYDALGRLTAVWKADRNRSIGKSPNIKYSYQQRKDKATLIVSELVNNNSTYRVAYELFDGKLRTRQVQVPGQNGWVLTDTYHNGIGQKSLVNAQYSATGTPGETPIVVAEGSVNGQTSYVYDGAGRVITETLSVAGTPKWSTITSYGGNWTHVEPPAGGIPTTKFNDSRGNTVELHQADDVTSYTYTPNGALETVTDPVGNVWTHVYNQRGLKILTKDPDAGDTEYTYDAAGRVTSTTNSRSITISYKFDDLGRQIETWQGAIGTGTKLTTSKYDTKAKGQLYQLFRHTANGNYSTSFESLDALYRPLTTRYSLPAADVGAELGKTYDFTTLYNPDNTVQSIGMPGAGGLNAESVVTSYDSLLRPIRLTGATSYVTATAYSDTNQLLLAELSTGGTAPKTWMSWAYERGTERLASSKVEVGSVGSAILSAAYTYDATGNVKSIADSITNDQQTFTYDYLRRLTDASATGGPAPYHHSWSFDKAGNRLTETIHGTTDLSREYHYPPQGHTLSSVSQSDGQTFAYGYDVTGNNVSRPGQALTWDAEGHLATSTPAGGQPTGYVYDGVGDRLVRKEPGVTTVYLGNMELRLDTATRVVTGTRYYPFGGTNMVMRNNSGVFYQAADHHGTNSCSINAATGSVSWRRSTPYGGTRGTTPATWPDEKGFVGGDNDGTTGLVHLGAREYDPGNGRFLSVDPVMDVWDPQQIGGYSYSNNSPVTFTDPAGTQPCEFDDCKSRKDYDPPCELYLPGTGCAWKKGDPKPNQIRVGNQKNGSNKLALDSAARDGATCKMRAQQVYCFGAKNLYSKEMASKISNAAGALCWLSPAACLGLLTPDEIVVAVPPRRAMTVGDVVMYTGTEQEWENELSAEKTYNAQMEAAGGKQYMESYGHHVEAHEAAHSEQWARHGTVESFLVVYGFYALESLAQSGEPDKVNNYELEANPWWGGYWDPPAPPGFPQPTPGKSPTPPKP